MKNSDDSFFTDTKEYTSKHTLGWIAWTAILLVLIICTFAIIGSLTLKDLPTNTTQIQ
jgi:hypothetical protein